MIEITHAIARKVLNTVDAGLVSGVGKRKLGEMCVEAAVCFALGEKHGDEPTCVSRVLRAFKIGLNDANWSSKQIRALGLRRLALAQLGSNTDFDDLDFAKRLAMMTVNKTVPRTLRIAAAMKLSPQNSEALEAAAVKCEAAIDLSAASDAARAARAASDAARAASYAASDAASDAARAASDAARAARAASDAARAASYAASDAASDAARYAARAARAASDAARYAARAASDAASDAARAARAASDKELAETAEDVVQILIAMNAPGCRWLDMAPLGA